MYEHILFDLDGTLTDPKLGITTCVQYALHRMGIEESDFDRLEPFIGPPLLESFCEFYGFDDRQGQQAIGYYRERFGEKGIFENEVYPGIKELLAELKAAGRKLAVASSKPQVYVERILEHFALGEYFDVVVGSELDGTRTKKEEVVEEALRRLLPAELFEELMDTRGQEADKAEYDSVVMVGDRRFDIEGAKEYHIASIGVSYGYALPGELDRAGADVIVETVKELGEVLGLECEENREKNGNEQ